MEERYPGQADTEEMQLVVHKHVMAVLPYVLVGVVIFVVGLVAIFFGAAGSTGFPQADFIGAGVSSITIPFLPIGFFLILISVFIVFASLYVWWQNKMFVTDEHIVDLDQNGLFQRQISTLRLSRVQDVSVNVNGPLQTILQYGTISVQSAGEKDLFHFDYVPQPYRVKADIARIYDKYVQVRPPEAVNDGLFEDENDQASTWTKPKKR